MTSMALNETFSLAGKRVWVTGHRGMVGSAIVRRLASEQCEILTATHGELDLTNQAATVAWMERHRPQVIFNAAARVGGIAANARNPAMFLYDNLMIALNVTKTAHEIGVEKLLWLGSSCIYPREAVQPIPEEALLTGPLESTNEAYALAKIAGSKLAEAYSRQFGDRFITAMPTNLYGPNDNFDPETAHVLPALLRKIHEAKAARRKTVTLWGTGRPLREFLHVDDLADACAFVMKHYRSPEPINIGTGREISIAGLARLIASIVGYDGDFVFDSSKPDGTPRKLLDTSRLGALGWRAKITLEDGVRDLYRWRMAAETASSAVS
ncbi:GDP-L-fucose synthase family protein [Chelativorans sp. YIM 93263]|uniref:GDP-L-fucose synthase family protein n=1 Tax=Chelativorans sp. YIM 93263 TaxID=2906648 RepID=UPI002378C71D|nr:GDP-L-fucose synthase [Chelativorans sp. YIM 93263]